jgi:hypothetical protein
MMFNLVAHSLVLHVTATPEATLINVERGSKPAETTDMTQLQVSPLTISFSSYNMVLVSFLLAQESCELLVAHYFSLDQSTCSRHKAIDTLVAYQRRDGSDFPVFPVDVVWFFPSTASK